MAEATNRENWTARPEHLTDEEAKEMRISSEPLPLPDDHKYIDVGKYAEKSEEDLRLRREGQAERYEWAKHIRDHPDKWHPRYTWQHYENMRLRAQHLLDQIEKAMHKAGYFNY